MNIRDQIATAKQQEQITVEQFALLAQLHPQTVYRKIDRSEIPGVVRYGRTIRLIRVVACGWLQERQRQAGTLAAAIEVAAI
jgi:hypothetical protein